MDSKLEVLLSGDHEDAFLEFDEAVTEVAWEEIPDTDRRSDPDDHARRANAQSGAFREAQAAVWIERRDRTLDTVRKREGGEIVYRHELLFLGYNDRGHGGGLGFQLQTKRMDFAGLLSSLEDRGIYLADSDPDFRRNAGKTWARLVESVDGERGLANKMRKKVARQSCELGPALFEASVADELAAQPEQLTPSMRGAFKFDRGRYASSSANRSASAITRRTIALTRAVIGHCGRTRLGQTGRNMFGA